MENEFYSRSQQTSSRSNFNRKTKKINDPTLDFSESTVSQTTSQKHLGAILDSSLSFDKHLISIQNKQIKQ